MKKEYEDRIQRAVEMFMAGYNCSQSVVAAYADLYGFTTEQALHMSASFGGGIGRMRLTCGAACGLFMLAGLEHCALDGADQKAKSENYALVQELAAGFEKANGSITCGELLGLRRTAPVSPAPAERNAEYYAKRPCARMVESAARLWAEHLERNPN